MRSPKKIRILPLAVFTLTAGILCPVQLMIDNPLLLAERFIPGGGWIEIAGISLYAAFLAHKMSNPLHLTKWRINSWTVFSVVFFGQLLLGILISDKLLMTGKLHLPIPAMIISGPLYRGQISVMTILFISTVILTGPAWCSHLCYFGAADAQFSRKSINKGKFKNKMPIKHIGLSLIIVITLILRFSGLKASVSLIMAIVFGGIGILIMVLFSYKQGKMIHCILYCPIGTLVSYLKFVNPFRLQIDARCTFCSACSRVCKYDALSLQDLSRKKPGITCTLC